MSVLDLTKECKPTAIKKLTYRRAYSYWSARLSNMCVALFDWQGLPFKQHELELRAQFTPQGYTGVVYADTMQKWIVAQGSGVGVTEYPDKWLTYVWANPKASGIGVIDKTAVIVRNNSLMISSRLLVDHFAHLLAHNDLSMQAILINSRATGYSVVSDEATKQRVKGFYEALEDGRTEVILGLNSLETPLGSKPFEFISDAATGKANNILDYWQVGQNLLKEFYTSIGISKATDKRERLIESEIEQEQPLFLFNIEDMLDVRREAAEMMSNLLDTNITVDVAESLKRSQDAPREEVVDNGNSEKVLE